MNNRKRPNPIFILGTVSLAVIVVLGTLLAIRAIRSSDEPEPVFELVEQPLIEENVTEAIEAIALTEPELTLDREIEAHHFNEDAYLSRKLNPLAARRLALELGGFDDTDPLMAKPQETLSETRGRYLYASVVLNLRKGPSAATERLRSLWANERVFEVAVEGDWSRVETSDDLVGYVMSVYLRESETAPTETTRLTTPTTTSVETTPRPTADRTMYVNEDVVNVRRTPNRQADIVATTKLGDRVRVSAIEGSWSKVSLSSGQSGYILSSLLSAHEVKPATPTTTKTPETKPEPTPGPTGLTFTAVDETRYVAVDAANVRTSPSTTAEILVTLSAGQEVKVTGVASGWSRVSIGSETGFISTPLLTETKPTVAPTPEPTAAPTEPALKAVDKTMYIDVDSANVRSEPSTGAAIVTSLSRGASVKVTGEGNGWSRISINAGTAYISSSLLTATKPTTPTTTAPTSPPTAAPTTPPAGSSINFVQPGSASAATTNFNRLKPHLRKNGEQNYTSFKNNGDGTITVDGMTFAYSSVHSYGATHYDGVQVSRSRGENPVRNRSTASGIPAQRGLVATKSVNLGGLPFGTVVFVEGYGLAIVADRGPLNDRIQIDLCYDPDEAKSVRPYGFRVQQTYIISIP